MLPKERNDLSEARVEQSESEKHQPPPSKNITHVSDDGDVSADGVK